MLYSNFYFRETRTNTLTHTHSSEPLFEKCIFSVERILKIVSLCICVSQHSLASVMHLRRGGIIVGVFRSLSSAHAQNRCVRHTHTHTMSGVYALTFFFGGAASARRPGCIWLMRRCTRAPPESERTSLALNVVGGGRRAQHTNWLPPECHTVKYGGSKNCKPTLAGPGACVFGAGVFHLCTSPHNVHSTGPNFCLVAPIESSELEGEREFCAEHPRVQS